MSDLPRISVAAPRLDGNERDYVLECLDSTWISSAGRFITDFERAFADYTGIPHCVALTSGTASSSGRMVGPVSLRRNSAKPGSA